MKNKYYINQYRSILDDLFIDYKKDLRNKKIGVLVSGGIDSSIMAHYTNQYFSKPKLLTLQTNKGKDITYVNLLSQYLKTKPTVVKVNQRQIVKTTPLIRLTLNKVGIANNNMQVALGTIVYLACQKAKAMKIERLFTGQGPDILLGGYDKYKRIGNNEELKTLIKNDLSLLEIDKKRDQAMANKLGIKLINPYLESEFVNFALTVPENLLIYKDKEKYLSRLVGREIGLPEKIVWRPKKAMQYSTGIQSLIH